MINEKVNLLIENSNKLDEVSNSLGMGISRKCNALNLTLKNESADVDKINSVIRIIKSNTSIFSNFRGNNLLTIAVNISNEASIDGSLEEIIYIYNELKKLFMNNQYLVLVAQIIFKAKDRINIDNAIKNTRVCYIHMKENHRFLTNQEDICAAAMIATTSTNFTETFEGIEKCYKTLKTLGFSMGSDIQSVSHMLSLINYESDAKCYKVAKLYGALKDHKVPVKNCALPILAISAFVTEDYETFCKKVYEVSNKLKVEKGFGSFTLGSNIRNMISVSLVSFDYVENLNDDIKETIVNTTNNIALTVIIAMQIAAMAAASSAAAASAASSSSGN